ncbi:MAG: hypothetical protein IPL61_26855 [Myxococcales bacterium]|nr:hypothetical protein [Myxococcales bacterium]
MAARSAFARILARAAIGPVNLGVVGAAVAGAVALASWPIALLGGAAYVALVAADVSNPGFRRTVLSGRAERPALPAPKTVADPALRKAAEAVATAHAEIERIAAAVPDRIRRNVTGALAATEELISHAAALVVRGDALARYLAGAARAEAAAEVTQLDGLVAAATDAAARRQYELAAEAARGRVKALDEIEVAHQRILANLTRLVAALRGVPTSLIQLQALDDQASDALTGDVGGELDRMNIELRAFEDTLATLVEVPT